jgi:hypothetical protein
MTAAASLLPLAVQEELGGKVQIVAVIVTALMLLVVLELVRRRRLAERYALLWMSVAVVLLVLAIWNDLLGSAADLVGIDLASNALFLAAFGLAFVLLLHFSVATSRLAEETKILAQEVARLDAELREERAARANGDGAQSPGAGPGERPAPTDELAPRSARTTDQ